MDKVNGWVFGASQYGHFNDRGWNFFFLLQKPKERDREKKKKKKKERKKKS